MAKKSFNISSTLNKNKNPQLAEKVPLKKTVKDTEVIKAQVEQIHEAPAADTPQPAKASKSRPKPKPKPAKPEKKDKLVRLTIDTPEQMHKKLKIRAIEKGISMRDYILQLLEKELKK